jgi:hypothetical protein
VGQPDPARSINGPCLARPYSYRAETGSGRVRAGWPVWTSIPRIGTMVTVGSRSLSGTSVPAVGGLPSPSQLRRVGRDDEGTTAGSPHVGSSSVRRRRLLRGSTGAGCPHWCSPIRDAVFAFPEADYQGGLRRHRCDPHRQRLCPQDHTASTLQGVGEPGLQAR